MIHQNTKSIITDNFIYREFVNGSYKLRNQNGEIINIKEFNRKEINGEAYFGIFLFNSEMKEHYDNNGSIKGCDKYSCTSDYLWFDIDRAVSLEQAKSDTIKLINQIISITQVDIQLFDVYFSGNKGFHICIPTELFNPQPEIDLPRKFRELALKLAKDIEIDTTIYKHSGLIRVSGSRHPESKLYKTMLSFEELKILNIEEIKKMALTKPEKLDLTHTNIKLEQNDILSTMYDKREQVSVDDTSYFSNYPCIKKMLEGAQEGNRHEYTMRLSCDLLNNNIKLDDALQVMKAFNVNKCNPPRSENEVENDVNDIFKRKYSYGCNDTFIKQFCNDKCPKLKEKYDKYDVTFGTDSSKSPFSTVYNSNKIQFLLKSNIDFIFTDKIHCNEKNIIYFPKKSLKKDIDDGYLFLPTNIQDYISEDMLFQDIKNYLIKYIDMPEDYISISALYAISTWVYDLFKCFPYLHIKGQPGVGKTRLKDLLHRIVFLGLPHSGSSSEASLFRITEEIRGTVVADENDFLTGQYSGKMADIYKQGFQQGNPVQRVVSKKDGSDFTKRYNAYSPKILTTINDIYDIPLASRCITLNLELKSQHNKPIELPPEADNEAEVLRNKLLKYRFDKLSNGKVTLYKVEGNFDPRSKQVFAPLLTIAPNSTIKNIIVSFLDEHYSIHQQNMAESLEGQVIAAINELKQKKNKIYCKDIYNNLISQDHSLKQELSARKIGSIIENLKLAKDRDGNGVHIKMSNENTKRLKELNKIYNINNNLTSKENENE